MSKIPPIDPYASNSEANWVTFSLLNPKKCIKNSDSPQRSLIFLAISLISFSTFLILVEYGPSPCTTFRQPKLANVSSVSLPSESRTEQKLESLTKNRENQNPRPISSPNPTLNNSETPTQDQTTRKNPRSRDQRDPKAGSRYARMSLVARCRPRRAGGDSSRS